MLEGPKNIFTEPPLGGPVYFNSLEVIFYEIMNSFVLWSQRLKQLNIWKYKHAYFNYHSALQPLVLLSVHRTVKLSHTFVNAIANLIVVVLVFLELTSD
jgi:hypothetical protein